MRENKGTPHKLSPKHLQRSEAPTVQAENERLKEINAALLEALDEFVGAYIREDDSGWEGGYGTARDEPVVIKAMQAIAKARGESWGLYTKVDGTGVWNKSQMP